MRNYFLFFVYCLSIVSCTNNTNPSTETENENAANQNTPEYALVIHGGAGYITRDNISDEGAKSYEAKLTEALMTGDSILKNGGSSLDAVEAVIQVMEDSPLFNAGKGAVFTEAGVNEMDASIMEGKDLKAGAVAGVRTIKSPISAAKAVMEKSKHVMLTGNGAEKFADSMGLQIVDPSYFYTENSWNSLQNAKKNEKYGTVGAAALDKNGNLAAGTSTGGMTNKMTGRVGDSPVIGAGTYADNETCAVSATGHGEFFIRNVVAYDIGARMKYSGQSLQESADYVINEKLKKIGADGGIIALDKYGNIALPFNTPGMFRGYIKAGEEAVVKLFAE